VALRQRWHRRNVYRERHPKHQRGVPRSAPLEDLYAYRAAEREVQRSLAENEYDIDFLTWARRYLKEDPAAILACRESVVERIMELIKQKLRTSENKRKNRQNNARRWGKTCRDFWDGHSVTLDKQGILTLLVSTDWPSIKLRLGLPIAQKAERIR
jgi:DNA-dependent RNA polymerase auxiliary subunit epsilon